MYAILLTSLLVVIPDAAEPSAAAQAGAAVPGPQEPPAAPLSLAAAVDEALERNPDLMALRRQYDVARQRPPQERFLPPPMFEAQIWAWPVTTASPANTDMYMFMFSQELPRRSKREARAAVAEKDAELAAGDIAVAARAIVEDVKRTYADLFLARREIGIHHETVDLLRQFAAISEAKYATGRISQQDVLKAVVELSRVYEHLVDLQERARLAEARLNVLLDRPPDAPIGPLDVPNEAVVLPALADLQQRAVERQPELAVARLAIERAEAAARSVREEYRPDFFVGGGYFLMPREAGAWQAQVGVTWPRAPWSRGRLDARTTEAEAEIAAGRARLQAAESRVRLAVEQAYVRAVAAAERAALLRTTLVPQSEQALEVSRVAYQTDRVDFLALIDNQRVLLDVQVGYYRALADLEQARADLERAVGEDMTAASARRNAVRAAASLDEAGDIRQRSREAW